jgi:hypothetical protein
MAFTSDLSGESAGDDRARVNLDGPGEIPIADHRDVANELAPDPPVVVEIEPLDRFREAGAGSGTCERVAAGTQDPRRLLGQLESGASRRGS